MSSNRVPSPADSLLERRDKEVLRANSVSNGGSSPRRGWSVGGSSPRRGRWSPLRISPNRLSPRMSLNRRGNKYEELTASAGPDEEAEQGQSKENESPLAVLSMDGIPVPSLSGRAQESPLSDPQSASSRRGNARLTLSTLRRRATPSQTPAYSTSKLDEDVKEHGSSQQKGGDASPIFRFRVQSSAQELEMVLPNGGHAGSPEALKADPPTREPNGEDDFDFLVRERQQSMLSQPTKRITTGLHEFCGGLSTLDDVLRAKTFLIGNLKDAAAIDVKGQTPLHIFANNKILATAIGVPSEFDIETQDCLKLFGQPTLDPESNLEKHVIRFLVGELLAAHPGAMMICDDEGYVPFEGGLTQWVGGCYNGGLSDEANPMRSSDQSARTSAVSHMWESTMKLTGRRSVLTSQEHSSSPRSPNDVEHGKGSRSAILSPNPGASGDNRQKSGVQPRVIRLTAQARFTLIMLSAVVDQLDRYTGTPCGKEHNPGQEVSKESILRARHRMREYHSQYGSVDIANSIVQRDLMKTILMIESDFDRNFVLSTSIIRRSMVMKDSVGPWLTEMLQSQDRSMAQKAVDYLKRTSSECTVPKSFTKSNSSAPTLGSSDNGSLIDEVSRLQDFVPSLLALGDKGIEDASAAYVVRRVLSRMISRPFAVTVILCDAVFLALVIVGFRTAVNRLIGGDSLEKVLQWIYVANTGIFYFIIREIGKTVSLFQISKRARVYFFSFWNVIDVMAIALSLSSTISMRYYFAYQGRGLEDASFLRGLLAVTTGFLWLRVLSLLKAINMQLATFVLAILQIAKDIIWFCVILVTLVVSFSQMFFTLLSPTSCGTDGMNDPHCKPTEYLLKVYTILLGDFGNFERDQFTSGFSVFLVVLYSFLVTVVLLNVLIAVASDSYEKCLLRSQHLFGRARVMLIAELVSFQNLLKKSDHSKNATTPSPELHTNLWSSSRVLRHWSRGSVLFFTLSMLVIAGWTVGELLGFSGRERHGDIRYGLASVVVNVCLFAAMMAVLATASTKKDLTGDNVTKSDGIIQKSMLRLLGASREGKPDEGAPDGDSDEWNGRVHYLRNEMSRHAQKQMAVAAEQAKVLENSVNQSELRLREELGLLEDNFLSLKDTLLQEVKGTRMTNQNVTIAVEELKALISMAASSSNYRSPVPSEVNVERARFVPHSQGD